MGIIATIVIGLVVGLLARFLMPGRDPMGFVLTALLGIIGAWLGTWVGASLGWYNEGEPAGFLMSVLGAMLVLFIYRMVVGNRRAALR
ncbi:MAG: GlsB/YeaQ/YmgE family stress response membrane protein [Pseudobdellovibrionaceae bacterium]